MAHPLLGYLGGVKYVYGPFTAGIVGEEYWEQGTVQLSGLSQRRARGIDAGISYAVAPGYVVYGEYLWNDQTQTGNNFLTYTERSGQGETAGVANGANFNNNIRAQGFLIGNVVNF